MRENVLVMLSSYNGEEYIEEQIETILAQEGVAVKLLVRDDGSTDKTTTILERYKKEGKLSYYVGQNLGWRKSFMQLVNDAPLSDFYAFADQDDYWMPQKLKAAISYLKTKPKGPQLYSCNGDLWKNGEIVGKVYPIERKFDKYSNFINPKCQGCTLVFNRELLQIVKSKMPQIEVVHDAWVVRLSILLGAYYYDNNSYILYRQHGNNQLGAETTTRETFQRRWKMYTKRQKVESLDIIANEILKCYGDILDEEGRQICNIFASYCHSLRSYLKLLFSSKYKCDNLLGTFGFKYRVLTRML